MVRKNTSQRFKLLDEIPDLEKATVFLPGAGTSTLIEDLIPRVSKLILNDISDELSLHLGSSFKIVSHFDYTFINPFGDPEPYIYALFKRER